jgi:TonB family protein
MRFFPALRALLPCLIVAAAALADAPPPPAHLAVDGNALVRVWSAPVLPAGVTLKDSEQLVVRLRTIIDDRGEVTSARVLKSPDPRLDDPALAAVKSWHFTPALQDGKPVTSCLDFPVVFAAGASQRHDLLPPRYPEFRSPRFVEATINSQPEADYPPSLTDRGLPGQVTLAWVVTPEGAVRNPRVLAATHADFVLPALASLAHWEFTPASRGDLKVPSEMQGAVDFAQTNLSRDDVLKANEITAPDGSPAVDGPSLQQAPDPVWPFTDLLEGTAGDATAEFTVTETGRVEDVKVRSASRPEFGQSLAAALATWRFEPVIRDSHVVAVPLLKHATFTAPAADAPADDPQAAVVRAARARKILPAAGLDAPLAALFRVAPHYPAALAAAGRPAGTALLEIVIAQDGRVRLTHAISASQQEFGWAAATAFSQWIFAPPRRGGQPVDVSVQVPVNFPGAGH